MNERILQIAKQAGLKFPSETDLSPAEKRFAELIVQECMEVGDKALQDGKWPGDELKEHFGVEE